MEEYLQYMKTLRSHMNDAEDQATKATVEEQMQLTNIRTLEKDIDSAKSDIAQVKEDTEKMNMAKVEICTKILEKHKKIASMESDISRLTQTLELIGQERVGLSAKLSEKRAYYSTVAECMSAKFLKQQEWLGTKKISRELKEHELVKEKGNGQRSEDEDFGEGIDPPEIFGKYIGFKTGVGHEVRCQKGCIFGKAGADGNFIMDNLGNDARKSLITELDSAKARLDEIQVLKAELLMNIDKTKLAIEDVKWRENEFKPELKAANITALEAEYNALLSDKAGETEFLQSTEKQVEKLKEISHVIKCACGEEYTVALNV